MNPQTMRDVEVAYDDMVWREHEFFAYVHHQCNGCDWENWNCDCADWESLDRETLHKLWRRLLDAGAVCDKKRDIARNEWAQARGWRHNPTKGGESHPDLGHFEVFEDAAGRRMGIVSHTYHGTHPKMKAYATERQLRATFLEDSWYEPGFATAVLFTRGGA